PLPAAEPDPSALPLDQLLGHVEPDPHPSVVVWSIGVGPIEQPEDAFLALGRNSDTAIGDGDRGFAARLVAVQRDLDAAAGGRILDGVVEEDADRLPRAGGVGG